MSDVLWGIPPDRLLREFMVSQFLGAYVLWNTLVAETPLGEEAMERGYLILSVIGKQAYDAAGGVAITETESQAYRYCGMEPAEEKWKAGDA